MTICKNYGKFRAIFAFFVYVRWNLRFWTHVYYVLNKSLRFFGCKNIVFSSILAILMIFARVCYRIYCKTAQFWSILYVSLLFLCAKSLQFHRFSRSVSTDETCFALLCFACFAFLNRIFAQFLYSFEVNFCALKQANWISVKNDWK